MNYLHYVIAAYAVFVLVLAWDWLSARWQIRQALRQAQARRRRQLGTTPSGDTELVR